MVSSCWRRCSECFYFCYFFVLCVEFVCVIKSALFASASSKDVDPKLFKFLCLHFVFRVINRSLIAPLKISIDWALHKLHFVLSEVEFPYLIQIFSVESTDYVHCLVCHCNCVPPSGRWISVKLRLNSHVIPVQKWLIASKNALIWHLVQIKQPLGPSRCPE
jgi:hypothetical protein